MDPLATTADLEDRLGRSLTPAEAARADTLLVDASASVRTFTHQQLSQDTSTVRLRVRRGKVRLPQRPVTAVTTVADVNGNQMTFTWVGDETVVVQTNLDPFSFEPWRNGIAVVDVTYTHGYAMLPDTIIGVVCSVVLRALGRRPEDSGITSETVAGYSYTLGSAAAAGGFGLLPDERDALIGYRPVGGFAQVGP
jgi:hypothetical protein